MTNEQRAAPQQVPLPDNTTIESRDEYRFLNPYNFVRYLPDPEIPQQNSDAQLLGRCPPPPHDRYIGLTGRISCTLEAVTPLFVSDAHDVIVRMENDTEHRSYRFFQYDGEDAIPATSLRGMIRSAFEAVTNSPFSVFNAEDRLEYRLDPGEARHFVPGIVRSLPQDDRLGEIALCQEAKIGAYYDESTLNVLDDSWHCGDEAEAILARTENNLEKVDVLARPGKLTRSNYDTYRGWVKCTGRTIETKRNESFFYFRNGEKNANLVEFDTAREADYNSILHAQIHDRTENFKTQYQHERLSPGDLVYVKLASDKVIVEEIALVKVARLRYRKSIGELLPEHLKPSEHYEQLDIASRVFGWVRDAHKASRGTTKLAERVAYAGRVRFSHATLTANGDKGVYESELPLSILSSPKPTTTLFYLQKAGDEPWTEEERKSSEQVAALGYDGPNTLRGRKFYRHHGRLLDRREYKRAESICDNQNRSVRGVRTPDNVFEFTIDFHNLAPVELGALLWVLQLGEEQCYHRLGYAKPLGFGSVRINVEEVQLVNMTQRYTSLDSRGGWQQAGPSMRGEWLYCFEEAMQNCYGRPIRKLDNICDLFALLREPDARLPKHIHYPRTQETPDAEGKNFEWFVENKRKSKDVHQAGPNHILEIAAEEKEGLPLLKKERDTGAQI